MHNNIVQQHFLHKCSFQRVPNQVDKLRKFNGVGGGMMSTPRMEIAGGGGSKAKVPSVGGGGGGRGVWIFSGTTQYNFCFGPCVEAQSVFLLDITKICVFI